MSRSAALALLTILALASMPGCKKPDGLVPFQPAKPQKPEYDRPLPPGMMALRKVGPEEYPNFARGFDKRRDLRQAIEHSLTYLAKPSSQRYFPYLDITHERAVASLKAFLQTLDQARSPEEFDQLIKQRFEVYKSIGWNGQGVVFFTGYYTPIFDGRKQPDGRFRYPLYRLPPDLVKDADGKTLGRKLPDGRTTPRYFTRREIEQGGVLRGQEIAWLKDPFEAYVVTVQGSARLRLEDGTLWELGYAGNNGFDYTPVARQMIADGAIKKEQLSLQAMMRYFAEHPDKVPYYTWRNERFVFFQDAPGGPFGSLNVPVTAYRTIATDKEVYPRAGLSFLQTPLPMNMSGEVQTVDYAGFACDQDTGGAIRAAGRCDVYMGIGPQAEAVAGRTGAEGELFYIFVRMAPAVAARPDAAQAAPPPSAAPAGRPPPARP